jgi:hypothetical protein
LGLFEGRQEIILERVLDAGITWPGGEEIAMRKVILQNNASFKNTY